MFTPESVKNTADSAIVRAARLVEAELDNEVIYFRDLRRRRKKMLTRIAAATVLAVSLAIVLMVKANAQTTSAPVFTPTCHSAEVGGTGSVIYHATNMQGWALAYFCDENHRWIKYGSAGFWADVPANIMALITSFFSSGTAADEDAYIASLKCSLTDPTCKWFPMLALFSSIPALNYWPPDGLVTQSTVAYRRSEAVGTYTYKALGTVALGVACDTTTFDQGYFVIPRASVTLTSKYDVFPLNVYGKCL